MSSPPVTPGAASPRPRGPTPPLDFQQIRTIAGWMDKKYVDPILGLVLPGFGDALGAALGLYAVYLGYQARVPNHVLVRMLANLGFDAALGTIPVVGWVGDFLFRAHQRNLALLEGHLPRPRSPETAMPAAPRRRKGSVGLWLALAVFIVSLVALAALGVVGAAWAFERLAN